MACVKPESPEVPANMHHYGTWERAQRDFMTHIDTGYLMVSWWIMPISRPRDADALAESNFRSALKQLGGEQEDKVEVHRFGHFAIGWYEVILVNANDKELFKRACELAQAYDGYPVVDEDDYSELEAERADEFWRACYSWRERAKYLREHDTECETWSRSFSDLIEIVRGKWFPGYGSELLRL